jgi:hypothetical protein
MQSLGQDSVSAPRGGARSQRQTRSVRRLLGKPLRLVRDDDFARLGLAALVGVAASFCVVLLSRAVGLLYLLGFDIPVRSDLSACRSPAALSPGCWRSSCAACAPARSSMRSRPTRSMAAACR